MRVQERSEEGRTREEAGPYAASDYPYLHGEVQDIWLHHTLKRFWAGRRILFWTLTAFLTAGIVFLIGSPNEYESSATLMPEKSSESAISGLGLSLLGQFSGLLGGLGAGGVVPSGSSIPVQLYPEVLQSTPVQLALLESRVRIPALDTTVTLYTYLNELQPFSLSKGAVNALLYAPSRLKGLFSDTAPKTVVLDSGIVHLDADQVRILDEMKERVGAEYDLKTGVLSISARMPDPHVAAQAAEHAVAHLTAYVTEYRTKKQMQNLAFIQERHDEAHRRFLAALNTLARFRDRNQNLTRDLARTEELRLEADYERAFGLYNSLSSRLEEARIQVQEETPVFQVLQPVTVPLKKSYPSTLLTLVLCVLLGLLAGAAYLFLAPDFHRLRQMLRQAS